MKDAGSSAKTIRNHHAIIAAALHQGVRWGWVRNNVAERAKPPRVEHRQVTAPSVDVVQQVIASAEERDPRLAPLVMLAALTGMRRGELCALRWSDLDLQLGIISVSRSLVVGPGGLSEKTTKTGRSRKIALDAFGIALLTEHLRQVNEWVTAAGGIDGLAPDAFVFSPFAEADTPFRPDNVTSFFIRVRDEVGAPDVRLHDLRHFTATSPPPSSSELGWTSAPWPTDSATPTPPSPCGSTATSSKNETGPLRPSWATSSGRRRSKPRFRQSNRQHCRLPDSWSRLTPR